MSLQSEYSMTTELQFGFKEHYSTIMCIYLLKLLNIMYLIIILFMSY